MKNMKTFESFDKLPNSKFVNDTIINESTLSEAEAEKLYSDIDNEGFGYWILEYGYDGHDDKLKNLCRKAKKSMNKLKDYIEEILRENGIDEEI